MARAADPWVCHRVRSGDGLERVESLRGLMLNGVMHPTARELETRHIVDTLGPELVVVRKTRSLRMGVER